MPRATRSFSLETWNLLHRLHGEKWGNDPILRFPKESERIKRITNRVVSRLGGCDAFILQEVSGDQLKSLRSALPSTHTLQSFAYGRVPKGMLVAPEVVRCKLDDPTEHLVTILGPAAAVGARVLMARHYSDQSGKGLLAVETGLGLTVVNTHLAWGPEKAAQLVELGSLGWETHDATIAAGGDFNSDGSEVIQVMGLAWKQAVPVAGALASRPRNEAMTSQTIDHFIVLNGSAGEARVVDVDGESDHNIVVAVVEP